MANSNKIKAMKPKPKFISVQSTEMVELLDDDAELMPYLRKKMTIFGCWPIKDSRKCLRWFIIFMTITFNTIPTVIFPLNLFQVTDSDMIEFFLQIIGATNLFQTNLIEFMQAMCEVCAISFWSFRMIYLSYHWDDLVRVLKRFQDVWYRIYNLEIREWRETVRTSQKFVNQMSIFVYWLYFIVGISYELVALWFSLKRQFYGQPGDMFYGIHAEYFFEILF